jgi:hypothetical protein
MSWRKAARKTSEKETEKLERAQALEEIIKLREESRIKWEGAEVIRRWRSPYKDSAVAIK